MSRNTISFCLRMVISLVYSSASEADCRDLQVKAPERCDFIAFQEVLHGPSGSESRDLVCSVDLLLLLHQRCQL